MPEILPADQLHTTQWRDLRRTGIGSSDILACIGQHPYRTAGALWADKVHAIDPPETPAMRDGRDAEPMVAERWARIHGYDLAVTGLWQHPDHPHHLASPDRLIGDDGGLEIKTGGHHAAAEWRNGPSPLAAAQAQWCMHVTARKWWYTTFWTYGEPLVTWRVERDDDLIAYYADAADRMWEHIESGEPPRRADFGEEKTGGAAAAFPVSTPEIVEATPEDIETIETLQEVKDQIKAMERAKVDLEELIKERMGDAEAIVTYSVDGARDLATWRSHDRRSVQVEALREAAPELVARFTTTHPARRLLIPSPSPDKA